MKSGSPSRMTAAHKTQTKIQAWSSLVFHCRHSSFNPSEAPPWDSRPVSGAGVVHYHLLHRPRSVPTALGPAPLATVMLTRVKSDVKLLSRFYQHLKTHIREGFMSSNVTSLFQLCPLLQHMYLENTLIVQR